MKTPEKRKEIQKRKSGKWKLESGNDGSLEKLKLRKKGRKCRKGNLQMKM